MATRKKTGRRSRSTSSGGGALESVQSERSADYTPTDLANEDHQPDRQSRSGEGWVARVRQLIAEHPLLAVCSVAGLAVTFALAARD